MKQASQFILSQAAIKHRLIHADCLDFLSNGTKHWATIFGDPPDNIGLGYKTSKDRLPDGEYVNLLSEWLHGFVNSADTVWFSFNAKWTFEVGRIVADMLAKNAGLEAKPCVQTFTFGRYCQYDLCNDHRPLWRLRWQGAPLFPDAIRVRSWRQQHGDPRADPRGRVPGDVFDFPRVTGNSRQRRPWHPTQLNEGLVERCIRLTTPPGDPVLDPFAGTGTTLRVCKRTGNPCTLIERDWSYCKKTVSEHGMTKAAKHPQ
jgi:hypothetical protein